MEGPTRTIIYQDPTVPVSRDGFHLIDPNGDYLQTLENCEGYYACPVDADGKPLGSVVGYTATYTTNDGSKMKWVGLTYYNFSKADKWPAVLTFFAEGMAQRLKERGLIPDGIIGGPWAGVKFAHETARIIGCQSIYAEKKPISCNKDGEIIEEIILGRYGGEISPGSRWLIGEELVNNASTTGKLIKLVEDAGGIVIGICCAINRSSPFKQTFWDAPGRDPLPIIGVIECETPQYRQDDPVVAKAIAAGNVVWKPKYVWPQLKAAMDAAR